MFDRKINNYILAFCLLFGARQITYASNSDLCGANGIGAVGDTGTLYLVPQGFYYNPMHNDFAGETDKLLTGSTLIGVLYLNKETQKSLQVNTEWRLLTPSFKTHFGQEDLPVRIGAFADWLEVQFSYAQTWNVFDHSKVKVQYSINYGHFGDKGGRSAHIAIHKGIHVSTKELTYDRAPEGEELNGGIEGSLISQEFEMPQGKISGLVGAGFNKNPMMQELYCRGNLLWDITDHVKHGFEARLVSQLDTEILTKPEGYRYEFATGLNLWRYYSTSIKYVSNYLKGDPVGQWYADLISLNLPVDF